MSPLVILAATAPCFPTAVGTTWTYDLDVAGTRGSLTQQITASTRLNESWEVAIRSTAKIGRQVVAGAERLLVSPNEVTRLSGPLGTFEPGMTLILASGPKLWDWRGRLSSDGVTFEANAQGSFVGEETLMTPAGKFLAKIVEVQVHLPSTYTVSRYWYKGDVGWVRIETEVAGIRVTAVLRAFSIPRLQTAR